MLKNLLTSIAAMSLVAAPAMAQSSASKLSLANTARVGASVEGEQLGGRSLLILAAVAAAAALIYFVVIDDDDSESA